jgi:8-oxo-dGTP pyrophosphatase MutT (NUDIX family)
MTSEGATIIIYFNDPERRTMFLLTGKETKFVTDLNNDYPEFREKFMLIIKEKEEFIGEDLEEAKVFFSIQAKDLEKGEVGSYIESQELGARKIQYDTPKKTDIGYSVKYRFLPIDHKRGVIKGGKENGESSVEAILREVREEVGMNIPSEKLEFIGNCTKNDVFSLNIGIKNAKSFIDKIKDRSDRKSGEVFELQFRPLPEILRTLPAYNMKSSCAIGLFMDSAATSSAATSSASSAATRRGGKGKNKKSRKSRKSKVRSRKGKDRSRKIK